MRLVRHKDRQYTSSVVIVYWRNDNNSEHEFKNTLMLEDVIRTVSFASVNTRKRQLMSLRLSCLCEELIHTNVC